MLRAGQTAAIGSRSRKMHATMNIIGIASLVSLTILTINSPCFGGDDTKKPIDQELFVGVWMPLNYDAEAEAGGQKPRLEFRKDGTMRMLAQDGEEFAGKWKWVSEDTFELSYPSFDRVKKFKVIALTKDKMSTYSRKATQYVRIASWGAKVPIELDSKDKVQTQ